MAAYRSRLFDITRAEWPRLVLEILVVVAGVTISFALNEWRSSVRDRQTAARTLADLRADVDMLITYVAFWPQDIAYEELKQTGTSRLIQDRGALESIIALHERDYSHPAEWDEVNRQAGVTSGLAPVYEALGERDRFRTLIRTNRLYKEGQVSSYRATLTKIREALGQVEGSNGSDREGR